MSEATQKLVAVSVPKPQIDQDKEKFKRGRPFKRGNPYRLVLGQGGRPVGAEDRANKLSVAYGKVLEQMVEAGEMTRAEAIALRMASIAISGKPGAAVIAAKELADRSEGKPMQSIQVSQVLDEDTAKRLCEIGEMLQGLQPKSVPVLQAEFTEE
jgi:hypothetical protein